MILSPAWRRERAAEDQSRRRAQWMAVERSVGGSKMAKKKCKLRVDLTTPSLLSPQQTIFVLTRGRVKSGVNSGMHAQVLPFPHGCDGKRCCSGLWWGTSSPDLTAEQLAGSINRAPGAPAQRPRRPRRTPSQISTVSLPAYMKEPGEQELVVSRGPDGEDVAMPAASAVEDDEDHSDPRGEAPAYFEVLEPVETIILPESLLHPQNRKTQRPSVGFFSMFRSAPPAAPVPVASPSNDTEPTRLALTHTSTRSTTAPSTAPRLQLHLHTLSPRSQNVLHVPGGTGTGVLTSVSPSPAPGMAADQSPGPGSSAGELCLGEMDLAGLALEVDSSGEGKRFVTEPPEIVVSHRPRWPPRLHHPRLSAADHLRRHASAARATARHKTPVSLLPLKSHPSPRAAAWSHSNTSLTSRAVLYATVRASMPRPRSTSSRTSLSANNLTSPSLISLASISHPLPHMLVKTEFSAVAVAYTNASASTSRIALGENGEAPPPGWEEVSGLPSSSSSSGAAELMASASASGSGSDSAEADPEAQEEHDTPTSPPADRAPTRVESRASGMSMQSFATAEEVPSDDEHGDEDEHAGWQFRVHVQEPTALSPSPSQPLYALHGSVAHGAMLYMMRILVCFSALYNYDYIFIYPAQSISISHSTYSSITLSVHIYRLHNATILTDSLTHSRPNHNVSLRATLPTYARCLYLLLAAPSSPTTIRPAMHHWMTIKFCVQLSLVRPTPLSHSSIGFKNVLALRIQPDPKKN
ncbi:hypothetical protein K438DRAFT_1768824 [Mycena galopus ATCC 62051]|nr:hypothetical protein K438DRAFT_1768824 [Mycena galopus ATCC 62051]